MTPRPDPVSEVCNALHTVATGATVVLAVSGGPDSVGMAHLVRAARGDLRAVVVHIRHGLRDDAADAEIAVQHATALSVPSEVVSVSVRVAAGDGPEDAARRARWAALSEAAQRHGASVVATGHTADDQAETVLLNIARGTGLAGLAGMRAVRALTGDVTVVRPVLGLRREVVRAVAMGSGLPVASDPTNTDPAQRRARARHDVLPRLAELTGGATDPVQSLTRLAAHARRDDDALEALATEALGRAAQRWGGVHAVDVGALDREHEAVRTRMVRRLLAQATAGYRASEATVRRVLALADGQVAKLEGGLVASRGGGRIAVAAGTPTASEHVLTGDVVELPEIGMRLRRGDEGAAGALHPWAAAGAPAAVPVAPDEPLVVRARRDGDRIATATGTRSVAHAMAAAHIPRLARSLLPVVEDGAGVLWIPGVAVRHGAAGTRSLRLEPAGAE